MRNKFYSLVFIIFTWMPSITACKKEKEIDTGLGRTPIAHAGKDVNVRVSDCFRAVDVELDGTASSDPDNDIVSYRWTKVFGTSTFTLKNANSVKARLENIHSGSYAFELAVSDAGGRKSTDRMFVEVDGPGRDYNLDVNFDYVSFKFTENYKYLGYDLPKMYYDLTTGGGTVLFPPLGFLGINIKEYADTAASGPVRHSELRLFTTGNLLSISGRPNVNFKNLIQQGGGPFSGTITISQGTAQQCYPEIFKNYPTLQVTGNLDTTSKLISLKISGKVRF